MPLMVPLPTSVRNLAPQITHPGLFLDKYVQSWDAQADTGKLSERVQKPAVEKVVQLAQHPPEGLNFDGLLARWEKSLQSQRVVRFKAKTVGPLTLHLARASALENAGICMHPIYGFVYMPGSGLKGMARSFAETVWLPTQSDPKKAWSQIEDVFGWAPTKDRREQIQNPNHPAQKRYKLPEDSDSPEIASSSGSIIFYDAWPTDWPKLGVDIVNNHHSHYYSGKASKRDKEGLCTECQFHPDDPNAHPPGDWEDPAPVYFLAVPAGQSFQFAVGKRREDAPDQLLELAVQWLMGALEYQGAGAKTAAGYGAFQITQGPEVLRPSADQPVGQPAAPPGEQKANQAIVASPAVAEESAWPAKIDGQKVQQEAAAAWQQAKAKKLRAEFRCTLELVTPAFLAGAKQNASDCELRPASLRGLLRWWWRTMHAGHVDARTLAQLESAVWGNTAAGSAVRVHLQSDPTRPPTVIPIPGKSIQKDPKKGELLRPDSYQLQQMGLSQVTASGRTQGLFYFSYGMDEMPAGRPQERKRRFVVLPGAKWHVSFIARDGFYKPPESDSAKEIQIPASMILEQAKAALWLLCRYGGIGSKSRRGFGSFADLDGYTVEQIREIAGEFRKFCQIQEKNISEPITSSLDHTVKLDNREDLEIPTPWKENYWFVLDQLGTSYQEFTQNLYKRNWLKETLGLPRKIGISNNDGSGERGYQRSYDKKTKQYVVWLGQRHRYLGDREPEKMRHASPVHFHVGRSPDGTFLIRVIAFPSPELPDWCTSTEFLKKLLEHLKGDIPARCQQHPKAPRNRFHVQPFLPSSKGPSLSITSKRDFGTKVQVKIISPRPKGGYDVQEEGRPPGALTLGTPPSPPPQVGEIVTVEIQDDDPKRPQYRWPNSS